MTWAAASKTTVIAVLLFVGAVATPSPGASAEDKTVNLNSIIRSLAPLKYLPQHSGAKRRSLNLSIRFKIGSANLTGASRRQLDIVAKALKGRKLGEQRFQVVGHTDASGGADQNLALSKRRAAAVRSYLIRQGAISAKRLISSGRGEEALKNPLLPKSVENRRVEFILIPSNEAASSVKRTSGKRTSGKEKIIKW